MIEKIVYKNFQGIADATITLSAGITTLMGPSGSGKSAARRGLEWVLSNSVSGQSLADLVSFWNRKRDGKPKDETSVTLYVDGHVIKREYSARVRGDEVGFNGYVVDGNDFPAIGRAEPPTEVTQLLSLDPFLNFSDQHDAPFLIGMSPADIVKQLNNVCNLSDIDEINTNANSMKRAAAAELSRAEEALSVAVARVEKFGNLTELKDISAKVDALEKRISTINERLVFLAQILGATSITVAVREKYKNIETLRKVAITLGETSQKAHEVDERLYLLRLAMVASTHLKEVTARIPKMEELRQIQEKINCNIIKKTTCQNRLEGLQSLTCANEVREKLLSKWEPVLRRLRIFANRLQEIDANKTRLADSINRAQLFISTDQRRKAQLDNIVSLRSQLPATCPLYEVNPGMCPVHLKFEGAQ